MPPFGGLHSVEHAFSRSSNSPRNFAPAISAPMSSDEQLLSLRPSGTSPADDALRQAFRDRGLADAGLADQHGIVLRAARQHLDRAADFLVATDDGSSLPLRGRLGEVARVRASALRGFCSPMRCRRCGPCGFSLMAASRSLAVDPASARIFAARPFFEGKCEQQPLDGDIPVAGLFGDLRQCRAARASSGATSWPAPAAGDLRRAGRARAPVASSAALALPPARAIRPEAALLVLEEDLRADARSRTC